MVVQTTSTYMHIPGARASVAAQLGGNPVPLGGDPLTSATSATSAKEPARWNPPASRDLPPLWGMLHPPQGLRIVPPGWREQETLGSLGVVIHVPNIGKHRPLSGGLSTPWILMWHCKMILHTSSYYNYKIKSATGQLCGMFWVYCAYAAGLSVQHLSIHSTAVTAKLPGTCSLHHQRLWGTRRSQHCHPRAQAWPSQA